MRLSTCLAVATAIVAPAKAIIQHPVSVYLLPSPDASPSTVKPPTLDGDEAFDVFANHFGVGSQSTFEKYQKKSWAHLVDPSHSSELTGEEQAKVIIIQGDLSPSDILPPTYQDSLADFELPSFPSYETMNFLQPFMIRGQKVVGHVLGENQDGLEEGFDKIWSNVKGSQVGKKMASAFDLNTSRTLSSPLLPNCLYAILLISDLCSPCSSSSCGITSPLCARYESPCRRSFGA
jgi:hypothetical protein